MRYMQRCIPISTGIRTDTSQTWSEKNLLDLILTSDHQMVHSIEHLPGLGISSYLCLLMYLYLYTQTEMDKKLWLRYHKGGHKEMTIHLAAHNLSELNQMNVNESWSFLWLYLKTPSVSLYQRKKLWMNQEALAIHMKKRKAWKPYKSTNRYTDHIRGYSLKKELFKLTRQLRKYLRKIWTKTWSPTQSFLGILQIEEQIQDMWH